MATGAESRGQKLAPAKGDYRGRCSRPMTEIYQPDLAGTSQEIIKSQIALTTPRQFTYQIIKDVGAKHGVTLAEIRSPDRHARVVRARTAAIRAVHAARPQLSYSQIGALFLRDHSSIMAALNRSGGRTTRSQAWLKSHYESPQAETA